MKVWGIWATLAFAILAFVLGQAMGFAVLSLVKSIDPGRVDTDGTAVAIYTLISNPVEIVTLVLAIQLLGTDVREYLGIDVPHRRDVAIAVAALAAAIALADATTFALGKDMVPPFQIELHRTAREEGSLPWLWLAIVLAAPVGEELLFRGFMFRGFVHEPRDAVPGILVISLIWSMLHVQYDWFGTAQVFAIGLLFGFVRWRTGSTTLAILMHVLLNLESVVETVFVMGGVSGG
jgi:membrane protease YdiL (CAAX protease family)